MLGVGTQHRPATLHVFLDQAMLCGSMRERFSAPSVQETLVVLANS